MPRPKWEHVVGKQRACLNISYIDYDVRDEENYDTDAAISFFFLFPGLEGSRGSGLGRRADP